MFFFGIFGVQSKQKEIAAFTKVQCRNCDKEHGGRLIKTYNYFHFFFIPLIKWNERYHVTCNGCNSIYEISKEKGKDIENGADIEITYWDLKPVESENNYASLNKRCDNCGREIRRDYEYCPYCGKKLNDGK